MSNENVCENCDKEMTEIVGVGKTVIQIIGSDTSVNESVLFQCPICKIVNVIP